MATCEHCGTELDDGRHPGVDVSDEEDTRACRDLLAGMLQAADEKLVELRAVGRALARTQPASHAKTKDEADLWARFYALVLT